MQSCLAALLILLPLACGGGGGGNANPSLPPPTSLAITEPDAYSIALTWRPPDASFDGYELESRVGSGVYQKVHGGLIPCNYSAVLIPFPPSTPENSTYTFRLRAAKGTSFSPFSNEASYTRGPNVPGQPSATYDWTSTTVNLSWTRNTTGSDGLRIERAECNENGTVTGTWISLPVGDPLASTYADKGISADTYYTYRVANLKGTLASRPSVASGAVFTGLTSISWITATYDPARAGVSVSWGSSTTTADDVLLERAESDAYGVPQGNWTIVSMPSGYRTSYLDQTVLEGGRYVYRATNLYGMRTTTPCATTYCVWIPMLAPINLQVIPTAGGLQLSWQNRSTTAIQVVVRRNLAPGYIRDIAILSPSATAFLDPVNSLGYYSYTVVAKGSIQEAASATVMAATLNPPDALTLTTTTMDLPFAADAVLRPSGGWAFAASSPLGVLSNSDPWPAIFPADGSRTADPLVQVDHLGLPHMVYATSAPYGTASALVHLWYDGATWKSETMARAMIPSGSTNQGWTFRLDASGSPHVVLDHMTSNQPYGGATESISYLHKVNGAWVEEFLSNIIPSIPNVGTFHLSLDDSDTPHILLGNSTSVVDCVRTGAGTWGVTTVPTGSVFAGGYDYLDGRWMDSSNGWIFYQNFSGSGGNSLSVVQMKNGVWLPPQILESEAFKDTTSGGRVAMSPDRSRIAILAATNLGFKVFHQSAGNWHTTLVASPATGSASTMRVGFDANQKLHLLLYNGSGYSDSHE